VAGCLAEKGLRDSIVQPAPSGAEGSFASGRVYAKMGLLSQFQMVDPVATGSMQDKSNDDLDTKLDEDRI
jgi:hypothetical protein